MRKADGEIEAVTSYRKWIISLESDAPNRGTKGREVLEALRTGKSLDLNRLVDALGHASILSDSLGTQRDRWLRRVSERATIWKETLTGVLMRRGLSLDESVDAVLTGRMGVREVTNLL